ncbi:MAG: lipoprotein [Gammaproteobacteria bacterium]|nr:MAG: lipoprotein [Gammaproteobacteria bacterium]TND04311.1 MAG: lipoprotein [Gammaproteobacteria bacterium]
MKPASIMSDSSRTGRRRRTPSTRRLRPYVRYIALSLLAAGLSGCASAPIQEMSDARQTINAARDAGAESEAPGSLGRAESLLTEAQRQLELMNYKRARNDAVEARLQAQKARTLANIVAETRRGITDAGTENEDIQRADGLLQQSVNLAAQGDMTRALQLAREARRVVRLAR